MKRSKILFVLILVFITMISAAQSAKKYTKKSTKKPVKTQALPKDVQVWTIDAERAICEGVAPMKCLLVKKQGQNAFELFYDNIIGFDYQEGYIYTIWVKEEAKTPPIPADASIYNYTLVKIVAKKPIAKYSNSTDNNSKPLSGMNTYTTKTLVINESKGPCEGNPDAKCLLIKEQGKKEFEIFYQNIEGFTFEEGYRQTILVNERYVANPMIKQTEPIYKLVKVIKKELVFASETKETTIEKPKTPLDKKWFLRVIKDTDSSRFDIEDNGVFLEIRSEESKVNGKAPCNTYFGGFKSDFISSFQVITFSTRMYCENMKFEDLYFSKLQSANRFELKESKLYLYKDDKLVLVFD